MNPNFDSFDEYLENLEYINKTIYNIEESEENE